MFPKAYKRLNRLPLLIALVGSLMIFTGCGNDSSAAHDDPSMTTVIDEPTLYVYSKVENFDPLLGTGRWKQYALLLLPDGSAFSRFPDGADIDRLTSDQLQMMNTLAYGEYELMDQKLDINWIGRTHLGPPYDYWSLTRVAEDWEKSDGDLYALVETHGTPTLERIYISETSVVQNGLSVLVQHRYDFRSDGRYEYGLYTGGASGVGGWVVDNHETGDYTIDGYTLTLNPEGATSRQLSTYRLTNLGSEIGIGERRFQVQP